MTMPRRSRIFMVFLAAMLVLLVFPPVAAPQSSPVVNVALNKTAAQSSTDTFNGTPTSADRAVDGNTNGNMSGGSVAQTLSELNPWWELDLGEPDYIDNIQVYTRTDCCTFTTQFVYVFVSEVPFNSHDLPTTLNQPDVTNVFAGLSPGGPSRIDFQRTARYIRIQVQGGNTANLYLAEVQAFGIQPSSNPGVAGQWARVLPDLHNAAGTLSMVHLSLLPSGKLLFWGRDKGPNLGPDSIDDVDNASDAYVWDMSKQDDPTTADDERLKLVRNTRTNLFCAGHSFLPNGNLFVVGGDKNPVDNNGVIRYELDGHGVTQTNIFNYLTETWNPGPDMRQPRWYPSLLTLSNGETLIMSGSFVTFNTNNGVISNQNQDTEILGLDGTLRRGPVDIPVTLPNFPFAHLGPEPDGNALVVTGTALFSPLVGLFYFPSTSSWQQQNNLTLIEQHDQGTSVMYDKGHVMVIGGRQGNSVTRDTETIDLNQASPAWTEAAQMHFERYYATSVLMPDGQIFVVGGSKCGGADNVQSPDGTCKAGAVMYPEIYDSTHQTWSLMSRQQTLRMYHSVALLLPDARILVTGGGRPGAYGESGITDKGTLKYIAHREIEIFSPPYLFNADGSTATRPSITTSPASINYGQSFNVGIGNLTTAQIRDVVLVRLPSVTHALNFDQQRVPLNKMVLDGQTLSVAAPANGIQAPPGPYMLFVISTSGVPSVANMVLLANPACTAPPAPTGLIANAVSNTQVNITWIAPTGTVDHYELDRKQSFSAQFVRIANITGSTSYQDLSVAGPVAYLYRVRAVCSGGTSSQPSNIDLATAISFSDDPLIAAATTVKAAHINQLRTAVNAVRVTAGLAQAAWTDPSLSGIFAKAVHITELRQNLNQALQAMGFSLPVYTDSTLGSGFVVKAVHVQQLRQAVR